MKTSKKKSKMIARFRETLVEGGVLCTGVVLLGTLLAANTLIFVRFFLGIR